MSLLNNITSINIALLTSLMNFIGLIYIVITFHYKKSRDKTADHEKIASIDYVDKEVEKIKEDMDDMEKRNHEIIEELKTIFESTSNNIITQMKLTVKPMQDAINDLKSAVNKQNDNFQKHLIDQHAKP